MSISTQITRLQQAKSDIKSAIEDKGVSVPSNAKLDTYDDYISQISGGATEPYIEETYDDDYNLVGVQLHGYQNLRDGLFYNCQYLPLDEQIFNYIRDTVPERIFYNCKLLDIDEIPAHISDISNYAFYGCDLITDLTMKNIYTVGEHSFQKCIGLLRVFINCDYLSTIGSYAFQGCTSLLVLSFLSNDSVTIGSYAFKDCTSLEYIDSGIVEFGDYSFQNCTSLPSISLNNTVSIGKYAFDGCTSLTIDYIPYNVETIGNLAFQNTGITEIEIECPTLQSSSGTKIFSNCTQLSKVWIRSTCENIYANIKTASPFIGCSDNLIIYAEPDSKPSGWGTHFNKTGANGNVTATVIWGQTESPW